MAVYRNILKIKINRNPSVFWRGVMDMFFVTRAGSMAQEANAPFAAILAQAAQRQASQQFKLAAAMALAFASWVDCHLPQRTTGRTGGQSRTATGRTEDDRKDTTGSHTTRRTTGVLCDIRFYLFLVAPTVAQ